jgi:hypothetical protein
VSEFHVARIDFLHQPTLALQCRWILTVPAIWSDQAQGFMRECAEQAGLVSVTASCVGSAASVSGRLAVTVGSAIGIPTPAQSSLVLGKEPECAAIASFINMTHSGHQVCKGASVLVVDGGGGTTDTFAGQVRVQ